MTDLAGKILNRNRRDLTTMTFFRKRDLLHNRVIVNQVCCHALSFTHVTHILPSFRQSESKYKIERKIKRLRNR